MLDYNDLLTLDELCEWLKAKPVWVYRQTRERKIPFLKVGKFLRFEKSKVQEWLNENSFEPEN